MKEKVADRFRDQVRVGYGLDGQVLSHQGKWPLTTDCSKCGDEAHLTLALMENGQGKPIAATAYEGSWLHDVAAFAIYMCSDIQCGTATTHWNQA